MISNLIHYIRSVPIRLKSQSWKSGTNLRLGTRISISRNKSVTLGDNVFIGAYTHIGTELIIGNDVMIASYTGFVGGDHKIDNIMTTMREAGRGQQLTVQIDNDVWIGHKVTILQGVHIAEGCVIAAGSVLTKDTLPFGIYAGNPARLLRYRIKHVLLKEESKKKKL